MKVYVFGNADVAGDEEALKLAKKLEGAVKGIEFVEVKPNEDLPFVGEDSVILMDAVEGIDEISLFDQTNLEIIDPSGVPCSFHHPTGEKRTILTTTRSVSVHDWDLGFQLKYLKKIGKLKKFTIIGLPKNGKIDYQNLIKIFNRFCHPELVSGSKTDSETSSE